MKGITIVLLLAMTAFAVRETSHLKSRRILTFLQTQDSDDGPTIDVTTNYDEDDLEAFEAEVTRLQEEREAVEQAEREDEDDIREAIEDALEAEEEAMEAVRKAEAEDADEKEEEREETERQRQEKIEQI